MKWKKILYLLPCAPFRSAFSLSRLFHFPPSPLHFPYKHSSISIRSLSSPGPVLNPPPPHLPSRRQRFTFTRKRTRTRVRGGWLSLVKEGHEDGEADSDISFYSLLRDTSFSRNFLRRAQNSHGKDIKAAQERTSGKENRIRVSPSFRESSRERSERLLAPKSSLIRCKCNFFYKLRYYLKAT